jgi:hypothetical protein
MKIYTKMILAIAVMFLLCQSALAEDLIPVPAAIQVSSKVSDGRHSLSEIANFARKNNIKVLITTDRDLMRWEYGIVPLANIIKKNVETKSIFKYGIERYLNEISSLQKQNSGLLIIPGIESAPFYFWEGSLLDGRLAIKNWHQHIVSIGLDKASDYERLPVIGNKKGLELPLTWKNIFLFWPVLIMILGGIFITRKQFDYRDSSGRSLAQVCRGSRSAGIILMAAAVLFLANGYPFRYYKFDQYHGDLGIMPYQNYIDYVKERGGLTFWPHLEAVNEEKIGFVDVQTPEHSLSILQARDYTGFSVFYDGYQKTALPGGLWDEALVQYCRGIRKYPVWATGMLGYDSDGDLSDIMNDVRTVLLVPEVSRESVLGALRQGSMYVVRGANSSKFILDKFSLKDPESGSEKTMGQTLYSAGKAQLRISGHLPGAETKPVKIKLIANGKVIDLTETVFPFDILYPLEEKRSEGKCYYRVEIESESLMAVTNPVFLERKL